MHAITPPAARGNTTRNELKRAARRLFAERGIAATGMREVVERAGQRNAAAPHSHFGSKGDLLVAACEASLDRLESGDHHFWSRPGALAGLLDAVEAILAGVGQRAHPED